MENLKHDNIWITKNIYDEAEIKYYENLAQAAVTPLAGEVAKARQLLIESRDSFKDTPLQVQSVDPGALKFLEKKCVDFEKSINEILERIVRLELFVSKQQSLPARVQTSAPVKSSATKDEDDEDHVDLFGSDSEEESEAVAKLKTERLAAYNEKKSKKAAIIAKSNLILDVKPWDDETDMKEMEKLVRKIETDGLLWGASKLVPQAFGIFKLQISCVVEDEKVSIDWLQEQITEIESLVQSVDIAAFNKI